MKFKVVLSAVALLLVSAGAMAGFLQPAPVTITLNTDGSGSAQGDQLTARNDKSDTALIGCGVRMYSDGGGFTFQFGFCQATDASGISAFCSTSDQTLLDGMKGVSDFSFIIFQFDADGNCTEIGNSTQSFYLPKLKSGK